MPALSFHHSTWIFLIFFVFFESPLAYSDLFSLPSGSNDLTTTYSLLTPNDQEPNLDEGPLLNIEDPSADWNLFTNSADENLFSDNLLSACSSDNNNNGQPSKVRARDTLCPANLDLPPRLPKLPDISEDLKEADGPNRQFVWLILDANGVTVGADEPKYYCLPHTPPYSIPVCGSGILSDRWFARSPLYTQIDKCSLILPPNALWRCPESEFFCCRDWVPYGAPDALTGPGLGTGYDCINLMDAGWEGYDSERIQH